MSRVRVNIERLVVQGLDRSDANAMAQALQKQLSEVLMDRAARARWAHSRQVPVLKLGQLPFDPGPAGGRKLGASVAKAIGKGLKT